MVKALKQKPKAFYSAMFSLMIPMIIQNLIQQSVAFADNFMVGFTKAGEMNLAAVTVATAPFFVIMVLSFGIQSGVGILAAQYWGKEDQKAISKILGIGFYFALAAGMLAIVALLIFPAPIMHLISDNYEVAELAAKYARIAAVGQFFAGFNSTYTALQRSCGNTKIGLISLTATSLLNLFLNWVFIFGNLGAPEMGVEGAALATLISHIAGSVILIVYSRLDKRLKLSLRLLIKPGKEITRDFFKYALPVIINETFWGLALMIYPMILGHMKNSDALHAAYNIAGSVEKIFTVAVFACGNAASVMVGNAIGAGESEESVFQTAKCLAIVSFLMGLAQALLLVLATVFLMGPVVFPLFTLSEYGAQSATVMLFLLSAVVPFRSIGFALGVGALRGGGDVKAVMIIDIATLYLVALPIGIIASRIFNSGIIGVWCVYGSILLEDLSKTLILIWRVSGKKWIRNVTRELV